MSKKKILVLGDADTVSFYRGFGPLLQHSDLVEVKSPRNPGGIDWADLVGVDAVMLSRPGTENQIRLCEMVKAIPDGPKLWIDFDDAPFSLPVGNPAFVEYQRSAGLFHKALDYADIITVSTNGVRDDLVQNGNLVSSCAPIHVIPNRCAFEAADLHSQRPIGAWRGSATHSRDLDAYYQEIVAHCKDHKIQQFYFFGPPHDILMNALLEADIEVLVESPREIHLYMKRMKEIAPQFLYIPLAKNPFNDAKSCIAAYEGLAAGALPVVFGEPDEFNWIKPEDTFADVVYTAQNNHDVTVQAIRKLLLSI